MRAAPQVAAAFAAAFGRSPAGMWAAPGRINLIGEHTDHNDGFALPLALPIGVVCAVSVRPDRQLVVRSAQRPDQAAHVDLDRVAPGDVRGWGAYVVGVPWALRAAGHDVPGLDVHVDGDVPIGAGLASSAALSCAVALAVRDLLGLDVPRSDLARFARRAENDFVGVPTGAMDQLVSLHGRAGHASLIDARTLQLAPIPLPLEEAGAALLVIDSGVRHQLVSGEYARRRAECEQAARRLGVAALRDVEPGQLGSARWRALPEPVQRRARHVVTEDERVLRCVELLADGGDPRRIGPLLSDGHRSLRDDFEVSVRQLDVVVDAAVAAGAHGARMTGGGFGGCAIALVDAERVQHVQAAVSDAFARRGWPPPRGFVATASAGAARLSPDPSPS